MEEKEMNTAETAAIEKVCPNCKNIVPSDSLFCGFCGTRLIPKETVKEDVTAEGKETPAAGNTAPEKTKITSESAPLTQTPDQADEKAPANPSAASKKILDEMEKLELQEKTKEAVGFVDRLYVNAGESICKIAKFLFVFGAVVSILLGLGIMFAGCGYRRGGGYGFFSGLFTIAFGVFGSWLGSLGLFAFGDLVRRVKSIDEKLK